MRCTRCNGYMTRDEDGEWACMQCGERVYSRAMMPAFVDNVDETFDPLSAALARVGPDFHVADLLEHLRSVERGWGAQRLRETLRARGFQLYRNNVPGPAGTVISGAWHARKPLATTA